MGIFFVYILKSSVCLTIFYLFYKLLLSRDTFHRFNRIALLSLIMLSVIIICEITWRKRRPFSVRSWIGEFASGGFHENRRQNPLANLYCYELW